MKTESAQTCKTFTRESLQRESRRSDRRMMAMICAGVGMAIVCGFSYLKLEESCAFDGRPNALRWIAVLAAAILSVAPVFLARIGRATVCCPLCGAAIEDDEIGFVLRYGRCATCGKTICENGLPPKPSVVNLLPMSRAEFICKSKIAAWRIVMILGAAFAVVVAIMVASQILEDSISAALNLDDSEKDGVFLAFLGLGFVSFWVALLGLSAIWLPDIKCPQCKMNLVGGFWTAIAASGACPKCNTRILPEAADESKTPPPPQIDPSLQISRADFLRRRRRSKKHSNRSLLLTGAIAMLGFVVSTFARNDLIMWMSMPLVFCGFCVFFRVQIKEQVKCPNCGKSEATDQAFATRRCVNCGAEIIREDEA